jgi:streptogramin lyase
MERDIERYLVRRVTQLGGVAYKFVSPGRVGVADRIVLLPGGVVWFVELKTATGRLSPLQKVFAADMRRLGANYIVIRSKEEVDKWMLNRQSISPTRPTAPRI